MDRLKLFKGAGYSLLLAAGLSLASPNAALAGVQVSSADKPVAQKPQTSEVVVLQDTGDVLGGPEKVKDDPTQPDAAEEPGSSTTLRDVLAGFGSFLKFIAPPRGDQKIKPAEAKRLAVSAFDYAADLASRGKDNKAEIEETMGYAAQAGGFQKLPPGVRKAFEGVRKAGLRNRIKIQFKRVQEDIAQKRETASTLDDLRLCLSELGEKGGKAGLPSQETLEKLVRQNDVNGVRAHLKAVERDRRQGKDPQGSLQLAQWRLADMPNSEEKKAAIQAWEAASGVSIASNLQDFPMGAFAQVKTPGRQAEAKNKKKEEKTASRDKVKGRTLDRSSVADIAH